MNPANCIVMVEIFEKNESKDVTGTMYNLRSFRLVNDSREKLSEATIREYHAYEKIRALVKLDLIVG